VEALWRREVAEEGTDRTKALGKAEIAELLDQKVRPASPPPTGRHARRDATPPPTPRHPRRHAARRERRPIGAHAPWEPASSSPHAATHARACGRAP